MKYFFLALIILLVAIAIARADVYVVTAPDKSVLSVSDQNDAVVPKGYSVDIIKGKKPSDLALDDVSLYTYTSKKFTLNSKKVSDKNKAAQQLAIDAEAQKTARQTGIDKLKTLGLTDAEISALLGR